MKQVETSIIGTAERVDFPALSLCGVPAKIDTGADSSAIWACDVRLDDQGKLSFVLFGEGSRFYSGQRIAAKRYRSSNVRNTSGIVEARYKVQLVVQIGERKIRAWFNLSDRSAMKYPVLIGRRLLHNKFVVDVSKRHLYATKTGQPQVLVLGAPEHRVREYFDQVSALSEESAQFEPRSFKDLLFRIGNDGVSVTELKHGRDIADYDLVYFKTHRRHYEFATCAAKYLKQRHVRFVDRELLQHIVYDKLNEMMSLALAGLAVPLTYCAVPDGLAAKADEIIADIGTPFVCKEINADRGRKNYLLGSKSELLEVLKTADASDRYMLQEYIENDAYVRALVLAPDVAVMIGRRAVDDSTVDKRKRHLNNPAGSPNAYLIEKSDQPVAAKELALDAARLMNRQVAGVDLIYDKRREVWYVLEVNTAPQIRSGAYVQDKTEAFAKFIDLQLNR